LEGPWVGNVHHDFVLPSLDAIIAKIVRLGVATPAAMA
jgi:hypothetical protein